MDNTDDNLKADSDLDEQELSQDAISRPAWQANQLQAVVTPKGGFFSIYKKGQGYWTRMGTAGAVVLLAVMTAWFIYTNLPAWMGSAFLPANYSSLSSADQVAIKTRSENLTRYVTLTVTGVFVAGFGLLAYWLQNKPNHVDFLIATDSEMKKVNWTSRKDLIGSTKVVILSMFLIAAILFFVDIGFGYFFYFIKVLKTKPF